MNRRKSIRTVCLDQGHSGNGGWRNLRPCRMVTCAWRCDYSPPPSSTAIWVVLFAITMMFAAFTSALIVRKGSSLDWQGLHAAVDPLLQYAVAHCQQRDAGSRASPRRYFHGRHEKSGRRPRTLALRNIISRPAFCGWSVRRVVAAEGRGALSGHQSEQFFFLFADGYACAPRAGRAWVD